MLTCFVDLQFSLVDIVYKVNTMRKRN